MSDADLNALAAKVEQLLLELHSLRRQNSHLHSQEHKWREERAQLIEKNELARLKVEAMITRLKSLEQAP